MVIKKITAKKEPKPLFPLQHQFIESLQRYQAAADMLAQAVSAILAIHNHGLSRGILPKTVADTLQEKLAAFDAAKHVPTEGESEDALST